MTLTLLALALLGASPLVVLLGTEAEETAA